VLAHPNLTGTQKVFIQWRHVIKLSYNQQFLLTILFGLFLLCGFPESLKANDIQLSNPSQGPTNPVDAGTPITYSFTIGNIDDGLNPPSQISVGIRVYIDDELVSPSSNEIEATGCYASAASQYDFYCNSLQEGATQTPSFTWNNPTSGDHTVRFVGVCQRNYGSFTFDCTSNLNASVSTTSTIVGTGPTAVAGPQEVVTVNAGAGDAIDVTLDGSASTDPDGTITSYQWFEGENQIATGVSPEVNLSAGEHVLTLSVTDDDQLTDTDNVTYQILSDPTASADFDQVVIDTDSNGSQNVTFDGSNSSDPGGNIVSYEWLDSGETIATGERASADLDVGSHSITLRVTDSDGATNEDQGDVVVLPGPNASFADAGPDQNVMDADNNGSQAVQLDGTGSIDLGDQYDVSYEWYEQDDRVATGVSPTVDLSVGTHTLSLRVSIDDHGVDEDQVTITVSSPTVGSEPVANAGQDQTLTDTDGDGNEQVTLDASGSTDDDGTITSYQWFENEAEIATGQAPTVTLSAGEHTLTLRVTDNDNFTDEDQVSITVAALTNAPTANAGQDLTLMDTNGDGSEEVSLDASGSSDGDGNIVSYQWLEGDTEVATGVTPTFTLGLGAHNLTLRVTDNDNLVGEDQVVVTVVNDTTTPTANAGVDQTLIDEDGDGSESVSLDGTGSIDPDGSIVTYQWLEGDQEIATGATTSVTLNVGEHTLTLRVTDDAGLTHEDQVLVNIHHNKNQLQIVAGENLRGESGETVGPFTVQLLDFNGIPLVDRQITWRITPENAATLSGHDTTTNQEGQASTNVVIQQSGVLKLTATVGDVTEAEFVINSFTGVAGLTKNQRAVGSSLNNLCLSLSEKQATTELNAAEQDLLATCGDLASNPGVARELNRLAPEEVAAQGTASIEATTTQFANINTRLEALRGGDVGVDISGLTVNYADISFHERLFDGLLPVDEQAQGGAAGDTRTLVGRWGAFFNGTINFGEKDGSGDNAGFDFDTSGVTMGADYRFDRYFVAGGALGFTRHDSEYNESSGNLEMDAWNFSVYGTYYKDRNIYIDGLFQIGSSSYDTRRRINHTNSPDQFGLGNTDGKEYAFNLSVGHEYQRNELTFRPYGRIAYTRAEIDAYTEKASNYSVPGFGSVLRIGGQKIKSTILALGGNVSYNIHTQRAVVIPQASFEWEHEFGDDERFISARFVNDPTQTEFSVETDRVDRNFYNLGLGVSAVFPRGRSGYLFYETRLGQDDVSLHRINAGMRVEF
jgi:outer membrane autotransporter protein